MITLHIDERKHSSFKILFFFFSAVLGLHCCMQAFLQLQQAVATLYLECVGFSLQ